MTEPTPAMCVRGCLHRDRHLHDCPCSPATHDENHPDHCPGCLPRRPEPVWCRPCQHRIRSSLGRIPDLAVHAASRRDGRLNTGHAATDATRHATRAGSPSGSPAWDTADEAITWAAAWADALADHLHEQGPAKLNPAGLPMADVTASVRYLNARFDQLMASPMAADVGTEALALTVRLERAAGRDRLTHRLKERCPSCDRKALVREDGAAHVECRGCGRLWTESEYARLAFVIEA